MEIKNGIIINGELHELVELTNQKISCGECSLLKECGLISTNPCEIVELFESSRTLFVNRGKVKVVKEE